MNTMRTIKFRAWDPEEKIMSKPFGFNRIDGGTAFYVGEDGENFCLDNDGYSQPECILMQFTGLKDKNGKEIYEGDIVTISGEFTGPIVWSINGFTVERYVVGWDIDSEGSQDMTEVIGNIHENPELLSNKD